MSMPSAAAADRASEPCPVPACRRAPELGRLFGHDRRGHALVSQLSTDRPGQPGITTLQSLAAKTDLELLRRSGIGPHALAAIRRYLPAHAPGPGGEPWTAEHAVELYRGGASVGQIARGCGLSTGTIGTILSIAGIGRHAAPQHRGIDTRQVVELYRQLHSTRAVAGRLGCTQHTVLYHLKKANVARPSTTKAPPVDSFDRVVAACRAHPDLPYWQIGRLLNLSESSIAGHTQEAIAKGVLPSRQPGRKTDQPATASPPRLPPTPATPPPHP
ncbi:hypothetical protein [Actinomadura rupiterrae]|uniref:hypothetical protein n=1 Tax=Actinomadura rupiterrae TaxID=559627 RepID=UPI0020A58AC5|nr:hypothetical protein [Actinomadura rupiterrae]MCP2335215.1 DNA-binding CsgD family transcriptional regulator [Actinomadura rupiterrae]